jgi:hypothetical protein
MTLFSMRTGLALLLAASLASCGGGSKATFPISGTVSGLAYESLVLTTGTQNVTIKPNGVDASGVPVVVNYSFPKTLEYGDPYLVTLLTQPPHQTCAVGQSVQDSAGHTAAINIAVGCTTNSYTVNGYVHGLNSEGLQLINGSTNGTITVTVAGVAANAAAEAAGTITPSFTFPAVLFNKTYGVTILTQPATQTCTVTNGNGIMQDAAVTNVSVDCVNNPT